MTETQTETVGRDGAYAYADRVAEAYFAAKPHHASVWGVPGHDDRWPDLTPEGRARWRDALVALHLEGERLVGEGTTAEVVLSAARDRLVVELGEVDAAADDLAPQTGPVTDGPTLLQITLGQSPVVDAASAQAYLSRCRQVPAYLGQLAERTRVAALAGRTPAGPLLERALAQCDALLAEPEALLSRGLGSEAAAPWRADVAELARDVAAPALSRYADVLRALLPVARPAERAGLVHVPGGLAAYAMRVRWGTTLALDPDDLHRVGLEELAAVHERMAELGSRALGTRSAAEVLERLRAAPPLADADGLLARAVEAVRRAEAVAPDVLPVPVAPPCDVQAMPANVAAAGVPPMYQPPSDGGRVPGAFLFNTLQPGPAGTFGLEAVTFHEAVPGHHAQYARLQHVDDLPVLLTAFLVIPYAEGWGLYAEQLADELGLYSDDLQRLGMLAMHAWRAVRLVVDTGLHARGWTRERALRFALASTPLPEPFMAAEVDRYLAVPGQALGYLVGQRELLALRERAQQRGGSAFDLKAFHAAVLGHGSVPLPTLRLLVERELDLS